MMRWLLLLLVLSSATPSWAFEDPDGGRETCGDGLDNDGDTLLDCQDPSCFWVGTCSPFDTADPDGDGVETQVDLWLLPFCFPCTTVDAEPFNPCNCEAVGYASAADACGTVAAPNAWCNNLNDGEVCNGVDDDGDGQVDEGFDSDGDGFFDPNDPGCVATYAGEDCSNSVDPNCIQVPSLLDCADDHGDIDADPDFNPEAPEQCDGRDEDCDGLVDEPYDGDGDGAFDAANCDPSLGYVSDCDDGDATAFVGAPEFCDGVDNDCAGDAEMRDGILNLGTPVALLAGGWMGAAFVANQSLYLSDVSFVVQTTGPTTFTVKVWQAPSVSSQAALLRTVQFEGAAPTPALATTPSVGAELVTGLTYFVTVECDPGCNVFDNGALSDYSPEELDGQFSSLVQGFLDPSGAAPTGAFAATATADTFALEWIAGETDADNDGFIACADCDDETAAVVPGGQEICDGLDNDCDGAVDDGFDGDSDGVAGCDADGDGVVDDCNDLDATIFPGATESCDGIDSDCDGDADTALDADGDGFFPASNADCVANIAADQLDCLDSDDDDPLNLVSEVNAAINPGATETCDGVDQDCDGVVDDAFDVDGDGFYDADATGCASLYDSATRCDSSNVHVCLPESHPNACNLADSTCIEGPSPTDCDDLDGTRYPGAPELCDGTDSDCGGEGSAVLAAGASSPMTGAAIAGKLCGNSWEATQDWLVTSMFAYVDALAGAELTWQLWEDANPADSNVVPVLVASSTSTLGTDGAGFRGSGDIHYPLSQGRVYFGVVHSDLAMGCGQDSSVLNSPEAGVFTSLEAGLEGTFATIDLVDSSAVLGAQGGPAATLGLSGGDEQDGDLDGEAACEDCDDDDLDVNSTATEVCNGYDDNCDTILIAGEEDADGDGVLGCDSDADGEVDDCDETNAEVNFLAAEVCNGYDDDCNGILFDGEEDLDGDGFLTCYEDDPANPENDCDDEDATVSPGASEICDANNTDNDCDGLLDVSLTGDPAEPVEQFAPADLIGLPDLDADGLPDCLDLDADGDGHDRPGDCDDLASDVFPGNGEFCEDGDQIDSDCDGDVNSSSSSTSLSGSTTVRFVDLDLDGFGSGDGVEFCEAPGTGPCELGDDGQPVELGVCYAFVAGDCDDDDALRNPDIDETCNGLDDNCDEQIDEPDSLAAEGSGCRTMFRDLDADGVGDWDVELCLCLIGEGESTEYQGDTYVRLGGDCDDQNSSTFPAHTATTGLFISAAPEALDGHDNDCDGEIPAIELDCDDDGSFALLPTPGPLTLTAEAAGLQRCEEGATREFICWDETEVTLQCDENAEVSLRDTDADGWSDALEGDDDLDGDGVPNYLDEDSDGDGVSDRVDADFDGDGIPNNVESGGDEDNPRDTDGDGRADLFDLDSDGDGIDDATEAGPDPTTPQDTTDDSIPDYLDDDLDNDGIPDSIEGTEDLDLDGIPNDQDSDSDGDGIDDRYEGTLDLDDDELANFLDTDSDGDGIDDAIDDDHDGDGVPNADESFVDYDGDGSRDRYDSDSDNDGIDDGTESIPNPDAAMPIGEPQGTPNPLDTDGDGFEDVYDLDSDGDGVLDALERTEDFDGDGVPNYRDTTSRGGPTFDGENDDYDGDGLPASEEGSEDIDGDGLPNAYDVDSDGDGTPDEVDSDRDGDGIDNATEGTADPDLDGAGNASDSDSDGDGVPDAVEGLADADLDGAPDYLDTDSDGDGFLDSWGGSGDLDGDGIPNYLDDDTDGDGRLDGADDDFDGNGIPDSEQNADGTIPTTTSVSSGLWMLRYSESEDGHGGRYEGGRRVYTAVPPCSGGRDCDDHCSSRCGNGEEVCDGIDNDCSGTVDPGTSFGLPLSMVEGSALEGIIHVSEGDLDLDGYLDCDNFDPDPGFEFTFSSRGCGDEVADEALLTDCSPACTLANPAATEVCNGLTDVCGGEGEGTDEDRDGHSTCGAWSDPGAGEEESPEQLFVVVWQAGDDVDGNVPPVIPLIAPRIGECEAEQEPRGTTSACVLTCDEVLYDALQWLLDPAGLTGEVEDEVQGMEAALEGGVIRAEDIVHTACFEPSELIDQEDRRPLHARQGRCALVELSLTSIADTDGEGIERSLQRAIGNVFDVDPFGVGTTLPTRLQACLDFPEEYVARTVWTEQRILESRHAAAEWECMRLYEGAATCQDIEPITELTVDFATMPDATEALQSDAADLWHMTLGSFTAAGFTQGTIMECWGDLGLPAHEQTESLGGDCSDDTTEANRDLSEGPWDLRALYDSKVLRDPSLLTCDRCLDGVDNNCDGAIDCDDPSCAPCFVGFGAGCAAAGSPCGPGGCAASLTDPGNDAHPLAVVLGLIVVGTWTRRRKT